MSVGITNPPKYAFEKSCLKFFNSAAWSYLAYGAKYLKAQDFHGYKNPYGHHPPGVPAAVTSAIYISGFDVGQVFYPTVSRALMILFHAGSLIMLINILAELGKKSSFIWVFSLLFCIAPISNFFGKNVCHESPTLFFMLVSVYLYIKRIGSNYVSNRTQKRSIIAFIATACLFGWPAFFLAGTIIFNEISVCVKSNNRKKDNLAKILILSTLIVGTVILIQLIWAAGYENLLQGFLRRTTRSHANPAWSYSTNQWIIKMLSNNRNNFTTTSHMMSIGGVLLYFAQGKEEEKNIFFLKAFTVTGFLHIFIFHQGAWIHPYWQFYLIPVELYFASMFILRVIGWIEKKIMVFAYASILLVSGLFDMLNAWCNLYNGYKGFHPTILRLAEMRLVGTGTLHYILLSVTVFIVFKNIPQVRQ